MTVTIDPGSGFCFGVAKAIERAEEELVNGNTLFCLGEIVHNPVEVERITEKGLITIDREAFKSLRNGKVLIRAHGEPPETYETARENAIEIIDATCPIVLKLQKDIRKSFEEMKEVGGQVVIFGKSGHPEVNGLVGQTDGMAIVVGSEDDFSRIDFSRPIRLFSQTTMGKEPYQHIKEQIARKVASLPGSDEVQFTAKASVCKQVSNRSEFLREFASKFDCVVFICGRNSSNGLHLFQFCQSINPKSYLVSNKEELKPEWFE